MHLGCEDFYQVVDFCMQDSNTKVAVKNSPELRIINEPTAAAIAYELDKKDAG